MRQRAAKHRETSGHKMGDSDLYDLLKLMSDAGRAIAAEQQGTEEHIGKTLGCVHLQMQDVSIVQHFAEQAAAHSTVWHGLAQAGISLTDVNRQVAFFQQISHIGLHCTVLTEYPVRECRAINQAMTQQSPQAGLPAALILSYLLKAPGCPVSFALSTATTHHKSLCILRLTNEPYSVILHHILLIRCAD